MELILMICGLILLDILAMRFGVDSRLLDVRDQRRWWPQHMTNDALLDFATWHQARLHHEAELLRMVILPSVTRPSLRVRLADGLRALAVVIDPTVSMAGEPELT